MGKDIIQTSDHGYAVAGITDSFGAGGFDFWLIKLAGSRPEVIEATVDVDPDTLNLKSEGNRVTAYIDLAEGYFVSDVDVSSILLNNTISVDPYAPTEVGDYDEDGIRDLMVKFDRAGVMALLSVGEATLTITGEVNGILFEGSDTIRAIDD